MAGFSIITLHAHVETEMSLGIYYTIYDLGCNGQVEDMPQLVGALVFHFLLIVINNTAAKQFPQQTSMFMRAPVSIASPSALSVAQQYATVSWLSTERNSTSRDPVRVFLHN